MVMINTSGIVLQYNECAVQAFGYSKEEVRANNQRPDVMSVSSRCILPRTA
jgi:hypothetical protein